MRGVVVSAGSMEPLCFYQNMIQSDDFVVCADGGYLHAAALGITPDLLIGDFDSFSGALPSGVKTVRLPCRKDYTDTHECVQALLERGIKDILLLGCMGTRFDHSYANLCLLKFIKDQGGRGVLKDACNEIFLIEGHVPISGKKGDLVSLIPFTDVVEGITTHDLEYPLFDARMEKGASIGVSNVMEKDGAAVTVKKGILLCMKSKDCWDS